MSRHIPSICAYLFLFGSIEAAEPPPSQFAPYEGVVNVKRSLSVRSGPSENYYRTSLLKPKDRITIVDESPDGWLAIKPPQDSFSWVSGQYVRQTSPTEGVITGDNVNVRVGTLISEDIRDIVQVSLSRGARVHIIERKKFTQGALTQEWFKIAPPPAEVRWVHGSYIQRDGNLASPSPPIVSRLPNQSESNVVAAQPSSPRLPKLFFMRLAPRVGSAILGLWTSAARRRPEHLSS